MLILQICPFHVGVSGDVCGKRLSLSDALYFSINFLTVPHEIIF